MQWRHLGYSLMATHSTYVVHFPGHEHVHGLKMWQPFGLFLTTFVDYSVSRPDSQRSRPAEYEIQMPCFTSTFEDLRDPVSK